MDIMTKGIAVLDWTPEPETYMNDNIHPCVRYFPQGFAGHKWWMITTPYPGSNARLENPILYWGDEEADGTPPKTWHGGAIVELAPGYEIDPPNTTGYNSDPCIHLDEKTGKLWCFWRVNHGTWMKETYPWAGTRATLGKSTTDGVTFSEKKLFCPLGWNTTPGFQYPGTAGDAEMAPLVLDRAGQVHLYAPLYQYSVAGVGANLAYGLAKWTLPNNDFENETFTDPVGIGQLFQPGFDFWHIGMCDDGKGNYFCTVTPQSGTQVRIGHSTDGDNYRFYNTPLLTTREAGTIYMYKASCVIKDDIFYMWYPNRLRDDGTTGPAYIMMTSIPVAELLSKLEDSVGTISRL